MRVAGIYVIQNPVGYVYVGQSRNIQKRIGTHRRGDVRGQPVLRQSLDTYGPENHEITLVLEMSLDCSPEDLDKAEEHYLEMLRYCGHGILNSRGAGWHGRISEETRQKLSLCRHSDETKQKMSRAKIGRKLSKEHCAKIGLFHRGKVVSAATRMKISQARAGVSIGSPSAETRAKMSESQKRRLSSPEARAALSASHMGRTFSAETREKIRQSNLGKVRSESTRKAISESKKGSKASPETKLKMSMSQKGRKVSDATKLKIKESWILRKAKLKLQ